MLKKLGKITMALSALSITTMVFAGGPDHMAMPYQSAPHGNFFAGFAAGMGMFDGAYSDINTATGSAENRIPHVGGDSFLGGLLAGYQKTFSNQVYLGIVANALYNSLDQAINPFAVAGTSTYFSQPVKNSFQGGLAIRLGRSLHQFVTPYILGGVEVGGWDLSTKNETGTTAYGVGPNTTYSISRTLVGPQVGAGVLFDITHHWQAGLEYAHTFFGDMSFTTTSSDGTYTHKLNVDQNQVLASAVYQFNA